MTYWHYVQTPLPGYPFEANTPPLASYYSPRVAPYSTRADYGFDYSTPSSPDIQYEFVPVYNEEADLRRAHRDTYCTSGTTGSRPSKPSKPPSKPRQATAQDRADAGIPAGYSTKNWDPAEDPIILLGSVFDANSLGKWIYDWTVYRHGPGTVALASAGDLWLSLISLSGKIRQAECLLRKKERGSSKRKLIEDFLLDGDHLMDRFKALLGKCEKSMLKVARRDRVTGKVVAMGPSSGCEFVDCIFGEGRCLQDTEDLIDCMVEWDERFDAMLKRTRKRRHI